MLNAGNDHVGSMWVPNVELAGTNVDSEPGGGQRPERACLGRGGVTIVPLFY